MFSVAETIPVNVLESTPPDTLKNLVLASLAAVEGTGTYEGNTDTAVRRLGGGRNSQVFAIRHGDDHEIVLKRYFRAEDDTRDRLSVEFSSLSFLWKEGERSVPEPLAAFPELGCALYAFVPGTPVIPHSVTSTEVDDAVLFWERLDSLARQGKGRELPVASEACFSPSQLISSVQNRRIRLAELAGPLAAETTRFLAHRFDPIFAEASQYLVKKPFWNRLLPEEERTLSPSDFGFHNAVRGLDGQLVFVDFEYFGWDDPVKLVSDMWLHPAMSLPPSLGERFLSAVAHRVSCFGAFAARLAAFMPLYGLKWVMILLNEFTRTGAGRRNFAGVLEVPADRRARQLAKAEAMLDRACSLLYNPVLVTERP